MLTALWILLFLISGLGAWGFYRYHHLNQRAQKLKQFLSETHKKIRDQEEKHTESKARWEQTEKKLRTYLQLMDTLMNTIPNPIYFKDSEGIYKGCNTIYAEQIMGVTRDRIIGRRAQDLPDQIPADLAAVCQREEGKMIEKGCFHTFETRVRCADGKHRDFLFNLAPVMEREGVLSGTVVVLSDLTDKNRVARHQMQKEKLEGVVETAGAVCHEFNQPLQAIAGYTELLGVKLEGSSDHSYIEKLTKQIERMRNITDKLQGVTRYETRAYAGNTKIIDINKASEKE